MKVSWCRCGFPARVARVTLGYAAAAATAGVEERKIANVTRHKNLRVLRRYIRCERPVEAAAETVGRPPRYCNLPEHTAQTAFRERRRRAAAGEFDGDDDHAGGERPVSLAIASIGSLAKRLGDDMAHTRELLAVLTDSEQLEAELAAVRADAHAEVSSAGQLEAAARRERLEADEAAEAALAAAAQAQEAEQAASERARSAEARERDAQAIAEDAERRSHDATARAEAAIAAQQPSRPPPRRRRTEPRASWRAPSRPSSTGTTR